MTARHEGADQPHHHVVDPALLAASNRAVMAHITACAVCKLAYLAVQKRGSELGALGNIESVSQASRDRLYAETRNLYCAEGLRLVMALGRAAMGLVELTS